MKLDASQFFSENTHSTGFFIQGCQRTYDSLVDLVENASELYSFSPAWNERAREAKKKLNLPPPRDEADFVLQSRVNRSKSFKSFRYIIDSSVNRPVLAQQFQDFSPTVRRILN